MSEDTVPSPVGSLADSEQGVAVLGTLGSR